MIFSDCERGVCGMQFSISTHSLITIQKGHWSVWHLDGQMDLKLQFTSLDKHKIVKGKSRKFRSELISLGVSSTGKFVASGGTGDTFLVHVMPAKSASADDCLAAHWNPAYSRNSDFCYGEVRCIKFNPKDDANLRIATGGNTGFIHFWSLKMASSKSKAKVDITPDRRYEHKYYSNHLQPENTRIPSTSDDDDDNDDDDDDEEEEEEEEEDDEDVNKEVVREGTFEMVVEYEDKEVVRKVEDPKFYQMRKDAKAILDIINRGGDPPKGQIKLL